MEFKPLPPVSPDPQSPFQLDQNVTAATIDEYLGNPNVAYFDTRMLVEEMETAALGFRKEIDFTIEGFRVVPYPLLGTTPYGDQPGFYTGPCLFDVVWDESLNIVSATPNYLESRAALDDLFPKDRQIVAGCGTGGYAYLMKSLLVYFGWDGSLIYNMGPVAKYAGTRKTQILNVVDGVETWATWRFDMPLIDFARLHRL